MNVIRTVLNKLGILRSGEADNNGWLSSLFTPLARNRITINAPVIYTNSGSKDNLSIAGNSSVHNHGIVSTSLSKEEIIQQLTEIKLRQVKVDTQVNNIISIRDKNVLQYYEYMSSDIYLMIDNTISNSIGRVNNNFTLPKVIHDADKSVQGLESDNNYTMHSIITSMCQIHNEINSSENFILLNATKVWNLITGVDSGESVAGSEWKLSDTIARILTLSYADQIQDLPKFIHDNLGQEFLAHPKFEELKQSISTKRTTKQKSKVAIDEYLFRTIIFMHSFNIVSKMAEAYNTPEGRDDANVHGKNRMMFLAINAVKEFCYTHGMREKYKNEKIGHNLAWGLSQYIDEKFDILPEDSMQRSLYKASLDSME